MKEWFAKGFVRAHQLERLCQGMVWQCWWKEFQKPKLGVLLNREWPADQALFAHTTSQQRSYADGRFESFIIRIPGKKYPFLPLDTIIDTRNVAPTPTNELLDRRDFQLHDRLDDEDMAHLIHAIESAPTIVRWMKKKICG